MNNTKNYIDNIEFVSDYIYIPAAAPNQEWLEDENEYDSPRDLLIKCLGENFYRAGDVQLDTWRINNTHCFFSLYAKNEEYESRAELNVIASCLLGHPVFGDVIATLFCDYGCGDWPEDEFGEPLEFNAIGYNTAVEVFLEEVGKITTDKISAMLETFETYAFVGAAYNPLGNKRSDKDGESSEYDEPSLAGYSGWAFKLKHQKVTHIYSAVLYPKADDKNDIGDIMATQAAIRRAILEKYDKITILHTNPLLPDLASGAVQSSNPLHKEFIKAIQRYRKNIDISFTRIPLEMLDEDVCKLSEVACGRYVE